MHEFETASMEVVARYIAKYGSPITEIVVCTTDRGTYQLSARELRCREPKAKREVLAPTSTSCLHSRE